MQVSGPKPDQAKIDAQAARPEADKSAVSSKAQRPVDSKGVSAPDALEVAEMAKTEVLSVSDGLKAVIKSVLTPDSPGQAAPQDIRIKDDSGVKEFIGSFIKEKAVKDNGRIGNVSIKDLMDAIEPEGADTVTISRWLRAALKAGEAAGADGPRQIEVPRGDGVSPFLLALLDGLLPGVRLKAIRLYKRKRAAKKEAPGKEGVEGPGETGEEAATAEAARRYQPQGVRLESSGTIKTTDKKVLRYLLGIGLKGWPGARAGRPATIELPALSVDYAGPSEDLEGEGAAFEVEFDGEQAGAPGPAAGTIIIELIEVGRKEDGSRVFGRAGG